MAEDVPASAGPAADSLVRDCITCRWTKPFMDGQAIDWSKKVCIGAPPVPVQVMTAQGPAVTGMFPVVGKGTVCRLHRFRGED